MQQNNFYIITGGPGVGKTTLLAELSARGYSVVEEDARRIIKEQLAAGGKGLPWENQEFYAQLMFEAGLKSYQQAQQIQSAAKVIFFDRALIDSVCYMMMEDIPVTTGINDWLTTCTYASPAFILPPWKEIYRTDGERKQNWAEAVRTYEDLRQTYISYGYPLIDVPKDTVTHRADFILKQIGGK